MKPFAHFAIDEQIMSISKNVRVMGLAGLCPNCLEAFNLTSGVKKLSIDRDCPSSLITKRHAYCDGPEGVGMFVQA